MKIDNGPLRILISGKEICGLISDLACELGRRGHHVRTAATPHKYFSARYDYSQTRFSETYLGREYRGTRVWHAAIQQLRRLSPEYHARLEKNLRIRATKGIDLYLRVWAHLPFDEETLAAAKNHGAKIGTFLMGSDVRDYRVYEAQYGVTEWEFPEECFDPPFEEKLRALRLHERYSDAVFSVPDQMGLALRPYHHLQVPVALDRFAFNVPGRQTPRVIHAPSAAYVKGTNVIERAIRILMEEGIPIEFVSLRDVPHDQVASILSDADVLVDELILHGPGWLSVEAMASGCAVATRSLADQPRCFRPPVWRIDEHNIVDRLRILLTDRELRVRLANEGREYVERNNRVDKVVDAILEKVDGGPVDYTPDYFMDRYQPRNEKEVVEINNANRIVADQAWYQSRVAGRARAGLVF